MSKRNAKGHSHLTLDQAAELIGMTGRYRATKLRRLLVSRERSSGHPIILRFGSKRANFRVTQPLLEKHLPEFFSHRDAMAEDIAEAFSDLREQMATLFVREKVMARRIRESEMAIAALTAHAKRTGYVTPRDTARHFRP